MNGVGNCLSAGTQKKRCALARHTVAARTRSMSLLRSCMSTALSAGKCCWQRSCYLGSSTRIQLVSASPPSPFAHRAAARAARMSGKSGYFLSRFLQAQGLSASHWPHTIERFPLRSLCRHASLAARRQALMQPAARAPAARADTSSTPLTQALTSTCHAGTEALATTATRATNAGFTLNPNPSTLSNKAHSKKAGDACLKAKSLGNTAHRTNGGPPRLLNP